LAAFSFYTNAITAIVQPVTTLLVLQIVWPMILPIYGLSLMTTLFPISPLLIQNPLMAAIPADACLACCLDHGTATEAFRAGVVISRTSNVVTGCTISVTALV
jgi:hypothetical protein